MYIFYVHRTLGLYSRTSAPSKLHVSRATIFYIFIRSNHCSVSIDDIVKTAIYSFIKTDEH